MIAATDGAGTSVFDSTTLATVAPKLPALWASAAHQNAFGDLSKRVTRMTDAAEAMDPARRWSALAECLAGVAVSIAGEDAAVTPFAASARDDGGVSRAARRTTSRSSAGWSWRMMLSSAVDEAPRHNRVRLTARERIALALIHRWCAVFICGFF